MTNGLEALQRALKQLRLSEISIELPLILREAEQQSWTYYELLDYLLNFELKKREEKNRIRRLKWAKFPYHKTLEDYNLGEQKSLSERQIRQLKEMNWLSQQYNLILLGPPGVGKTHLAVGVGLEAIEQGYQVMFLPMGELTTVLKIANICMSKFIRPHRHLCPNTDAHQYFWNTKFSR